MYQCGNSGGAVAGGLGLAQVLVGAGFLIAVLQGWTGVGLTVGFILIGIGLGMMLVGGGAYTKGYMQPQNANAPVPTL